jgi:oligopeptidase B
MNTFNDFIACAKHLVNAKYTDHSIMAIEGRSAGGLLIGAVLNIFPGIAHVAIAGMLLVNPRCSVR